MTLNPLLPLIYEPLVRTALLEDLGRAGDITADAIVPAEQQASLVMRARQPGDVEHRQLALREGEQSLVDGHDLGEQSRHERQRGDTDAKGSQEWHGATVRGAGNKANDRVGV